MSEAAAAERSPDSTSIRRWPRYKVYSGDRFAGYESFYF